LSAVTHVCYSRGSVGNSPAHPDTSESLLKRLATGSRFRQEIFLAKLMELLTSFGRIPEVNRVAE
jgi:hypothetical protein